MVNANQIILNGVTTQAASSPKKLRFSDQWTSLGPFKIGTREASWGADPLEIHGGFRNLSYNINATFRSALGEGGLVSWSNVFAKIESSSTASIAHLDINFPNIKWGFLRSIYGWAGLQHQAWIRGHLENDHDSEQRVTLFTDGLLELWINGQHYWGGDFYTFRRAPIVVTLTPGSNRIDCRVIHDVRAMGGSEPPTISITLEARAASNLLDVEEDSVIVPDIVDGRLSSPFASIICRNEADSDIEILSLGAEGAEVAPLSAFPLRLLKGQSRPVALTITPTSWLNDSVVDREEQRTRHLSIDYRLSSHRPQTVFNHSVALAFKFRSSSEPHKFTFQHSSGSVSYAIVRPPSKKACQTNRTAFPILLNLHGAGLDADSHEARHMLDEVPDVAAWTIFPTGMSPWSGDDWHTWGFRGVKAAIEAIPSWINVMGWQGPQADIGKWLVIGHSNGGQGVWFILTHHADTVIAAAPVSGYTSIQNYVPYTMWHAADPRVTMIIQSSLASFRHELLTPNFDGVPILQQHGSADDNVPAYHSRLMSELLANSQLPSTYEEIPGKGHWYEGIMTTAPLKRFYDTQLQEIEVNKDRLPTNFEIICPHTHDLACRGGLCVDQLEMPDLVGKLNVHRDDVTWQISTSNVHRFHFEDGHTVTANLERLVIDGQALELSVSDRTQTWLVRVGGHWQITSDSSWKSISQRYGKQIGTMDAILRTSSAFVIRSSMKQFNIALQLSRNLLQYFGADSEITLHGTESAALDNNIGNEIIIVEGQQVPHSSLADFPLRIDSESICLRQRDGHTTRFKHVSRLGAIFIRPLPNERLELVIWGADSDGIRMAARLAPMLTGIGQPDFVILGHEVTWKGSAGVLAMGFFDYEWNVSQASFIT